MDDNFSIIALKGFVANYLFDVDFFEDDKTYFFNEDLIEYLDPDEPIILGDALYGELL